MVETKVIEKDLAGALLTQALMDVIRGEVLHAAANGAQSVDIIIRRVGAPGIAFPEIIVDYGGELLRTLAQAVRIISLGDLVLPRQIAFSASNGLTPNRVGRTTEYKRGEYYLSHTVWEDGHEEVEIHRCKPEELFHAFDESERHLPAPEQAVHTCDKNQFGDVFARFAQLPAGPAQLEEQNEIQS